MKTDFDLAIVGSGFGGSLMSMVAERLGLSVVLLERGTHPRFAIGESTSPLANVILEHLAERYDLPRLLPLASYGPWQETYPEVVCGLKRGFTFFQHQTGQPYRTASDRSNQLLVAASPNNYVADTHWLRSSVDHFLVREAIALGVTYVDQLLLTTFARTSDGSVTLEGERLGRPFRTRVRFVIDASGPHGFISRVLGIGEASFAGYPPTQTLYSHFTNVRRADQMPRFTSDEAPPYPIDDAALHHVFDGGWMWVLRFNNGVTSAGIAVEDWLAEELKIADGETAWPRFLKRFPSVAELFDSAESIIPFVYSQRLAYRASAAAGEGWVMLPSAAAFVDPLLSTGIPLTLLGIERLARLLEEERLDESINSRISGHGALTLAEADHVAHFIAACYASFKLPLPFFNALSMFYFVAASFSEMARRAGRSHLVSRFFGADHQSFNEGLNRCANRILGGQVRTSEAQSFEREVSQLVAVLNIAGLCDASKQNWYGVNFEDVIGGAHKLGLTAGDVRRIIASASWARGSPLGHLGAPTQ
ncbi:MAG TPA: tryptophan 7-halogenase [Blastocatellia bacterium]|nr:tryptophan 7-halogenase [Blastocatellia bacterium]